MNWTTSIQLRFLRGFFQVDSRKRLEDNVYDVMDEELFNCLKNADGCKYSPGGHTRVREKGAEIRKVNWITILFWDRSRYRWMDLIIGWDDSHHFLQKHPHLPHLGRWTIVAYMRGGGGNILTGFCRPNPETHSVGASGGAWSENATCPSEVLPLNWPPPPPMGMVFVYILVVSKDLFFVFVFVFCLSGTVIENI